MCHKGTWQGDWQENKLRLVSYLFNLHTMYIGDPHNVAAIISPGRNLANPKSAEMNKAK